MTSIMKKIIGSRKPHTVRIGRRIHRCRTLKEGRQYLYDKGYTRVTGRGKGSIYISQKSGSLAYID